MGTGVVVGRTGSEEGGDIKSSEDDWVSSQNRDRTVSE